MSMQTSIAPPAPDDPSLTGLEAPGVEAPGIDVSAVLGRVGAASVTLDYVVTLDVVLTSDPLISTRTARDTNRRPTRRSRTSEPSPCAQR
jgi:hypothetical protein